MKNFFKLCWLIALVAVIGFLAACGGEEDGGALGDEVKITGQQVYTMDETATGITYTKYTGSKTIDDSGLYGGTGTLTNGKFSLTLGTPSASYLYTFDADDLDVWTNVTLSNPQVKTAAISDIETKGTNTNYAYLYRGNETASLSGTTYKYNGDDVMYVYVDSDVTISGKGRTETDEGTEDGIPYKETMTTKDFNLKFQKGWNAVRMNESGTASYTGSITNPTGVTYTITMSISLGDPSSCKWILNDYSMADAAPSILSRALTTAPETKKAASWFKNFKRR